MAVMVGLTAAIHLSQKHETSSSISLNLGANLVVRLMSAEGIERPCPNKRELGVNISMKQDLVSAFQLVYCLQGRQFCKTE